MIKIENIHKQFGDFKAVENINLLVNSGEVLGFLGPNGAGKSTTMKMITGFIKASAGTINICGHDIEKSPLKAKILIGYLPEGAPAYGDMQVVQFLGFIAEVRGFSGQEKKERVKHVVKQLALESVLTRPVDNLSKGFKRRVGIAQAIIHDPMVLILDEPTDGLDPNQKHQVRELIRGLSKDKIVIISTHILEEVSAVCTRAVIIANGKIVADSTPEALIEQSRYHRAITLELAESDSFVELLSKIEGVREVEASVSQPGHYTLLPEEGVDIHDAVNHLVQEKGWKINALYVETGRLDDVFRSLTKANSMAGVV